MPKTNHRLLVSVIEILPKKVTNYEMKNLQTAKSRICFVDYSRSDAEEVTQNFFKS